MTDSPRFDRRSRAGSRGSPPTHVPSGIDYSRSLRPPVAMSLASLPAVLGRDEKDDVRLADPWISHSHCELFQQGGVLVVRDLDSKNGVFMHGVRIREAEVLPGDCLTLGRTEITFRYRRATRGDEISAAGSTSPSRYPRAGARRPTNGGPMTEELLY